MTVVSTGQITITDVNDGFNSAIVYLFRRTTTNAAPAVSPTGAATYIFATGALTGHPPGWTTSIPASSNGAYLWVIQSVASSRSATDEISNTEWSTPVLMGQDGAQGPQGVRGTISTSRAISGSSWLDSEADAAITAAGGTAPLTGDIVTLYNNTLSFSQTRIRSSGGTWTTLTAFFGGDVIVNGTLATSKLIVTDTTNLVDDAGLEYGGGSWDATAKSFISSISSPRLGGSRGLVITGNGTVRTASYAYVNCQPGDQFYAECWVRKQTNSTAGSIFIFGSCSADGAGIQSVGLVSYLVNNLPLNVWTKMSTIIEIPAGLNRMQLCVSVRGDVPSGTFAFDDFVLRRRNEGSVIVDGAVDANKLAANSVTAGKIAAGVITAEKLAVGAVQPNLVINPTGLNGVGGWEGVEGSFTGSGLSSASGWGSTGRWGFYLNKANSSDSIGVGCRAFAVVPGRTYAIRLSLGANTSTTSGFYARVNYASSMPSGGFVNSSNRSSWADLVSNGPISAAIGDYTYTWTCPPNVHFASFGLYSWSGGPTTLYFSDVEVREQNTGVFISDGAVVADKLAANAVTAGKIAANAVTAGTIAAGAVTTDKLDAGAVTAAKISVTNLASISATIGLLRTATSGARLEIESNQIRVYDSSNVLRMRMGIW